MGTSSLRNPYTNRSAIRRPDDFFGRVKELKNIYTRIQGGQSVSLVGERRVGKSSVLNALEFERGEFGVSDELCFVFVDMQYIGDCDERTFLMYLLDQISVAGDIRVEEPTRRSMEQAAKTMQEKGKQPVIILDEFDVLVHNEQITLAFFGFLRSWSARFRVPFVVASREGSIEQVAEDDKTGSAFLNIFGPVYIGPMQAEDAIDLIRAPAESCGVEFNDDEVNRILGLAGHFPLFLQIACFLLFEMKIQGEVDWVQLTRAFTYEATPHFEYLLKRLSAGEIDGLKSLTTSGNLSKTAESELLRKGILLDSCGSKRIFSTVFSELVRPRELSRSAVSTLIDRLLE